MVYEVLYGSANILHIAYPPNLIFARSYYILDSYVDSNVLMALPVKSNPKEFSFAGVSLTLLLVIIVLSILCLNVLITVIICR